MTHSAVLPSQNHAIIATQVIPGNPQFAHLTVKIQDVSFNDALKISAEVARHGLPALVWEPPITVTATSPAVVDPEPVPEATPSPSEPEQQA